MRLRNAILFRLAIIVSIALPSFLRAATPDSNGPVGPVFFDKNVGQAPPPYRFISHNGGVVALFSDKGVDVAIPSSHHNRRMIKLRFLDGNASTIPEGHGLATSYTNYLIGKDSMRWISGVENYAELAYPAVYPKVDLLFHGSRDRIEHDFHIAPGGDANLIHFAIKGAGGLYVDASGELQVPSSGGTLVFHKPSAYQVSEAGTRRKVVCEFAISPDGSVRFRVGDYDHERELVIDPVFGFSTYLDGSNSDSVSAVTTDSAGNVYVTGYTYSLDFPVVSGIQSSNSGSPDAFVSKFDPTGHTLLYSTYLGGSYQTFGNSIAIDRTGNIIVAGTSSSNDFPHAGDVPALTCEGNNNCFFIASLKPDGSGFNYAGLIGGILGTAVQTTESGNGVVTVGASGAVYLAGVTDDANFDITPGTLATTVPGYPYNSAFVLKLDRTGALVYSTIIPGNLPLDLSNDTDVFIPNGIAVNSNGQATIAGSAGPGLPSTPGVVQPTFPNDVNTGVYTAGFVLQLNASASSILYATYLPGTDTVGGLAVDAQGNSYVTGETVETNLPVSSNAYQKTPAAGANCPCQDGFVLKLNPTGKSVVAATYLGGTPTQYGGTSLSAIALDSNSNVFVGGMTSSPDFPLANPFTSAFETSGTNADMVLAEMKPDLSALLFGSFLSSTDQIWPGTRFSALAVDSQGDLIAAGQTNASDFPTTSGSYQPSPPTPNTNHAVIAKLNMAVPAPSACFDSWNLDFGDVPAKKSVTQVLHLTNCGSAPLKVASIASSASTIKTKSSCGTIQAGAVCPISVTYTPVDSSLTTASLSFTDNAVITPQVVAAGGLGIAGQLSPNSGVVDFGHLLVNTTGGQENLLFTNTGTTTLTISGSSVDGDFALAGNGCNQTLQPNTFCVMTVVFSPTAAGIRTGTLTITSNDPRFPKAGLSLRGTGDSLYPIPIIAQLDSPSAAIGNGSITIWVYGENFYPASVVLVNGQPQPTTYSSETELQATLDSTVTSAAAELPLTVSNPTPGGGASVAVPLNLYATMNLYPMFLSAVPNSSLLYAAMGAGDSAHPNTVIPINPATGQSGSPIPVGNDPRLLAPSSDGSYLYVALNQDQTVQRINLHTRKIERTFPFPPNVCPYCGSLAAADMKSIPGTPTEVVIAFGSQMALYNDAGLVNSAPANNQAPLPTFSSFVFYGANPLTIYALPFTNARTPYFNMLTIDDQGLHYVQPPPGNYGGNGTTGTQVVTDGNLLYTSGGQVWNPITQLQVGSFPVTVYNNAANLTYDSSTQHLFTIGDQGYGSDSSAVTLSAYNTSFLQLTGTVAFPRLSAVDPTNLTRWGANGFAFLSPQVTLLRSAIAGKVLKNSNPHIKYLWPTSAPQNSSDVHLTINGSGFSENSVAAWNGTSLPTSYLSSTVLTTTIPASYLTNAGTGAVTVTSPAPGGGTSPKVSFAITALAPAISFSASSVSFPTTAVGSKSAARVIAIQNTGTATLNISGIAITGTNATSFSQTNNCGNSLMAGANCAVAVTFLPQSAGSLSALLTVSDNAAGSPQGVNLAGTGK
jgi:hypothetical protein